jgi:hypothetical protein
VYTASSVAANYQEVSKEISPLVVKKYREFPTLCGSVTNLTNNNGCQNF